MTRSCSLELISFRASAGIFSRAVNTGVLAHVAGESALVNVWMQNEERKSFRTGTAFAQVLVIIYFLNRGLRTQFKMPMP